MRELSNDELDAVSGAGLAGTITMGLVVGWSSAVVGFGAGSVIGGPIGGLAGAATGFTVGSLGTIGYALASEEKEES